MQKKNNLAKDVLATGALAALVAAAAGAYFLYGSKDAKKNRKKVMSWTLKAKGEILEKLENLEEVSEPVYHKIVKEVSDKYQTLKKIDKKDIIEFVTELKKHWKSIEKEVKAFHKKNKKKKK